MTQRNLHKLKKWFLFSLVFTFSYQISPLYGQTNFFGNTSYRSNRAVPGDSVQAILRDLAKTAPQLLAFVPETGKLCLLNPSEGSLNKVLLTKLQDAFYYDIQAACKFYGEKYLADWRVLVAKASRETCWGTSYLCNRANNYFGIRRTNKEWACTSFSFCDVVLRPDPEIAEFVVFPNFESSLWMFMHTIYSPHFLERLPDLGSRVWEAIQAERRYGMHYWQLLDYGVPFTRQLNYIGYNYEELLSTWSEYPINNLCVNCSRQTDRDWVQKVNHTALRSRT